MIVTMHHDSISGDILTGIGWIEIRFLKYVNIMNDEFSILNQPISVLPSSLQ